LDNGAWTSGYFVKHYPHTIGKDEEQQEHEQTAQYLILQDGPSDWGKPRELRIRLVDPETVGQYTGFKDKNGAAICEGDIVRYTRKKVSEPAASFHSQDLVQMCEIVWDSAAGAFRQRGRLKGGGGWEGNILFTDARAKENLIEVIGNVHDNPELLEKEKQ
jgi:uncharacterized phage protein (TIGR01671 family)